MKTQLNAIAASLRSKLALFFVLYLVMGFSLALTPQASFAQSGGGTPPANTTIGNQATATYTDANGNTQTVNSNQVNTNVQQVYALRITGGTSQSVSPGNQLTFAHTITNNGNGSDTFNLATSQGSGAFNYTNVNVYPDNNNDGVPDNTTNPITDTGQLAAGAGKSVVIIATVPTTASNGDSQTLTVTATSANDPASTAAGASATDTGTLSNTVVNALKSLSSNSGNTGDTITVTLTFTNNGTADATNFVARDTLDTRFIYQTGSAKVNGTAVTDNASNYTYATGVQGGIITATLGTLSSGGSSQQKTVTFKVKINNGTEGATIPNQAFYNDDQLGAGPSNAQATNQVQFTVNQTYGVSTVNNANTDTLKASANQGATLTFINTYKNTGSSADRFNIATSNSSYPSGTTFKLFKSDGSGNPTSPITDSNGDGVPDIGPIASGSSFQVILQASLPSNAGNGTGPYDVTKTATSIHNITASASFTDELTAINASSVDVTNNRPYNAGTPAPGQGIFPSGEPDAVADFTIDATNTTTVTFDLYINNTGNTADSYNLAASPAGGDFSQSLPAGYSVQFKNTTTGNTINNTGNIAAGGNLEVTAVVSVPAGASAGEHPFYFRAQSSGTGATDVKHDAITVQTVRKLTLTSDDNATVAPGGNVTYTATLTNAGNKTENDGSNSSLQVKLDNSAASNWTATVYIDANNNGAIDSGEAALTTATAGSPVALPVLSGGLAPGAQRHFLIKVSTSSGVNAGDANTTTLTIQDDGTAGGNLPSVSINDITKVVAGNLVITKKQSRTAGNYASTPINAKPGDTVYYQIVVTNNGTQAVSDVNVSDQTPQFTTMASQPATSGDGSPSVTNSPSNGDSGTVKITVASLGAGQSFTVTFSVKLNN